LPERLFLFVHYYDAHVGGEIAHGFDYTPRPPAAAMAEYLADTPGRSAYLEFLGEPKDPTHASALQAYAAAVASTDRALGALLEALAQHSILVDAVVVITSDHGETFWEAPQAFFRHTGTAQRGATRAVGLIRTPTTRGLRTRSLM